MTLEQFEEVPLEPIPVVWGEDHVPNDWDLMHSLAETVEELRALRLLERDLDHPILKHRPGGVEHDQGGHGNWSEGQQDEDGQPVAFESEGLDPGSFELGDTFPGGGGQGTPISETVVHQGDATALTIQGDRTTGDDIIIQDAFGRFESEFPGMLPEEITVSFEAEPFNKRAAAWVDPYTDQAVIKINAGAWLDAETMTEHIVFQDPQVGMSFMSASLVPPDQKLDAFLESIMFHEMAHTVAANEGFQWEWPEEIPFYTQDWFQETMSGLDPRLPSDYAALNAPEFFAEAFTEVAYEGDSASAISLELVDIMDQHFASGVSPLSPSTFEVAVAQDSFARFLVGEATVRPLANHEIEFLDNYQERLLSE